MCVSTNPEIRGPLAVEVGKLSGASLVPSPDSVKVELSDWGIELQSSSDGRDIEVRTGTGQEGSVHYLQVLLAFHCSTSSSLNRTAGPFSDFLAGGTAD